MRNISFALTTSQFLDGSKDVTRRVGWRFLKAGDHLMAVEKSQGLKPGEKIKRLGEIKVVSVRRERLWDICYEGNEIVREGFGPGSAIETAKAFVQFFVKSHKGCADDSMVTRIEFKRVGPKAEAA